MIALRCRDDLIFPNALHQSFAKFLEEKLAVILERRGSTMIAKHLDRRTMAAMESALEKACEHLPSGGTHDLRKRVARAVIRCAQTGNCTLDALVEAGQSALERLPRQKGANIRTDRPDAA